MTDRFENPAETKVEDETVSDASAQKRIDQVADKAAAKPANTVKKFEKDKKIFTI
jgi:hypothetical protein